MSWGSARSLLTPSAVSALAVALILLAVIPHGPGITNDSWAYMDATYGIAPLDYWPPGYSWLLAPGLRAGVSPDTWAVAVNCVAVVGMVFVAWEWLKRHVEHPTTRTVALVVIATGTPTIFVATHIWSEAVFNAVTLAALVMMALDRRGGTWSGLTYLVRYAGIATALTAVAVRPRYAAAVVAGLGLAVVIAGLPHAAPTAETFPLPLNMIRVGRIADWALFPGSLVIVIAGIPAVLAGLTYESTRPIAAFTVIYLVGLVIAARFMGMDPIDTRLLSPVFAPLVLLFARLKIAHRYEQVVAIALVALVIAQSALLVAGLHTNGYIG